MRYKKAVCDSLNLAANHIEAMFIYNSKEYSIEAVKTKSVFTPKVWSATFGKSLTRNIIEAKIIHTYLGITIPLKVYAVSPKSQTLEFAGLHGYNERSQHLMRHLQELESQLQYARVMRMDIAIDFEGKIPKSIMKTLSKHREPFKYGNTSYYKTAKEKKVNRVMDIKIYDKSHQAKLDYKLMRLEFCFKSEYLKKVQLKDIETLFIKMEKSIKKATGLSVKINHILELKK